MALAGVGKGTPTRIQAIVGSPLMATSPHSLSCNHRFDSFTLSALIKPSNTAMRFASLASV